MISLQFSIINIFLSFKGVYTISLQHLRDLREEERKRERVWFERLESHKFIGIFWCDFDLVFSGCMFLGNLRDEICKSLYFRLHYTIQLGMDILNVCGHFWMEELIWLWKMWDERERWKIESVSESIRRREGETVRLTGECVLEEEWMPDICISFGMWDHWIFQFTFKQNDVYVLIVYLLFLDGFVIICKCEFMFEGVSVCMWVCVYEQWIHSVTRLVCAYVCAFE